MNVQPINARISGRIGQGSSLRFLITILFKEVDSLYFHMDDLSQQVS